MRVRILALTAAVAVALGLVAATVALAQGPIVDAEAQREAAAAVALEANPGPELRSAAVFTPPETITVPLFVGLSDIAADSYLVDPDTGQSFPLFDGFELWGATYDPDNERVLFNRGPTLYEWPLNGSPASLGSIKGADSGANLSMYGLAYHNGVLYASRGVQSVADPEGIYTVDPATLSATLVLTFSAGAAVADIGGLAADPATGDLYGTNDDSDLRGLVRLESNGDLTLLAPYPEGENDIDGLAIGDGRAYLVTDEPGPIFVYDFAVMTYTAPITSPWAISELFAGAGWISPSVGDSPSISLEKTVGTDPSSCATTDSAGVTEGTTVTYCYEVTNTGSLTLTRHNLEDSALGGILNDFLYNLAPGASAFITESVVITAGVVNTATWTAYNPGPTDVVTATDTATVTIVLPQAISLIKTVGTDPSICATTTAITVTEGSDVTYCYEVLNTGTVTLTRHTLDDSALGPLLNDFDYTLAPGESAFITETASITTTVVNTATWTAYNPGPSDIISATASATVTALPPPEPSISLTKTVGTNPSSCATTDAITVTMGTDVTYCYQVDNTGAITLTLHDLVDSELGDILTDFPTTLTPGASAFITATTSVTTTVVNTATWTAYNEGPIDVVTATAEASVTVLSPEIDVVPASLAVEMEPGAPATRALVIDNLGTAALEWTLFFAPETCDEPGALPWASAAPDAGTTAPGGSSAIEVTFDPSGLGSGLYDGVLCIASNDADEPTVSVPLSLSVGQYQVYQPIATGGPEE